MAPFLPQLYYFVGQVNAALEDYWLSSVVERAQFENQRDRFGLLAMTKTANAIAPGTGRSDCDQNVTKADQLRMWRISTEFQKSSMVVSSKCH